MQAQLSAVLPSPQLASQHASSAAPQGDEQARHESVQAVRLSSRATMQSIGSQSAPQSQASPQAAHCASQPSTQGMSMTSTGSRVDPTEVVRSALQHAASVSGLMLTTEALIAEKPKKPEHASVGAGAHANMDL